VLTQYNSQAPVCSCASQTFQKESGMDSNPFRNLRKQLYTRHIETVIVRQDSHAQNQHAAGKLKYINVFFSII
jgi:hypothetical protein